jgi:hypothetical protein
MSMYNKYIKLFALKFSAVAACLRICETGFYAIVLPKFTVRFVYK